MAVALVDAAADALVAAVSTAEILESRFWPACVIVLENVAGAWKVGVDFTSSVLLDVVPMVQLPLAVKLPLSLML